MKSFYLKLNFMVILCLFCSICYANMVGGFGSPEFFTKYDKQAVDNIAKTPNAKSIRIIYPKQLKSLATKIKDQLQKKSAVPIKSEEVNLVDTATVKYRHDAVVVTIGF